MVNKIENKTGKAYAFFDCRASKEEIGYEIPFIRDAVQTPGELELSLAEDVDSLRLDSDLLEIAQEAKKAGLEYVMKATCPNVSNKQTAGELSTILNQAYQSPLYKKGEQFRGEVVYEENREYIFRG